MKQFTQIAYLSLLWIVALATSASAQDAPSLSPNFEVRYTTEGAGVESNGSVEGFIPLFQTPGKNATFLQGKLFLDDDSQMGGNVLLGYRVYDKNDDRVTGAYVSLDARDTSRSYFKQLGIGFETLGKWDLRINGYLPLGDTRNQIGQFYFGNPFFQKNNIVIQQANLFEAALHGVDAEVGTRLTKIGSGDLRGYAGIYYLGNDNKEAFGWKARVEARPTKFLSLGASLQNDSLFDTRAVFSVGLSFPGSGATRGGDQTSNFARMGEFVERQAAIPVIGVNTVTLPALTNPATSKAWSFVHVAPGNSNGTAESPYGYDKIQQAVNDAAKTDSIVYIRGDEKAIIPGFTLLSGVKLLTNTPERFIDTVEIGSTKLPFSGSRIVPKLGGTVSLSSNTVLSGFDINAANGASVRGTNISNVTITDNRIQGTKGEAILLSQVTGNVDISNNTIGKNTGSALLLSNTSGNANVKVTGNNITDNLNSIGINFGGTATATAEIAKNTISNSGIGVDVNLSGSANLSKLNIIDNTINSAVGAGIRGTNVNNVTITNNRIQGTTLAGTNSGTQGEAILLSGVRGNIDISNNTLTKNAGTALSLSNTSGNANVKVIGNNITDNFNSIGVNFGGTATGTAEIAKNTISSFGTGVDVSLSDSVNLSQFNISDNSITAPNSNNPLEGIKFTAFDQAVATVNVTGNNIRNTTNDAIGFGVNQNTKTQINIANNKIENVKGSDSYSLNGAAEADGIDVQLFDSASSGLSITGNTVNNTTGSGISISDNSDAANQKLDIAGNTVSNTEYEGIRIDGVDGNITVNKNTINNTKYEGISLENTTGKAEISGSNNISGATGAGISGTNVNNVTITGSSIQGTQGEGILLSEATGNVDISNNTLTKNTESALLVNNTSGNANIKVTGNNITDNFNSIGINLGETATGTAEIAKNTISNFGIGVDATLSGSANLSKLDITDNNITAPNSNNPLEGIKLRAFDEANATVNVTGNNIRNTTNDAIGVGLNQNTKTQVNIANNKIENVKGSDSYSLNGAAEADGIDVQLFDSASSGVSIIGNTVNNTTGSGINISDNSDATNQKLDIAGNTVSNTEYEGIRIDGVDGNITVNNNNISNASTKAISLGNIAGKVDINALDINGGNSGIRVTNVNEITIADSNIQNTKTPAIDLENVTGKVEISGVNINGATGASIRGINLNNVTITDNLVKGTTLTGTNSDTQGEGIFLSEVTGKVDIRNNTIAENAGNALSLSNSSGNADIKFTANNITNNFNSIGIKLGGTATGSAEISENTISNSGIGVDVTLGDDALNLLDITNNTITAPNNGNLSEGIKFRAFDQATATVNVTGNTISNTTNDGISVGANQDTLLDLNISSNKIENVKGSDAYGLGGAAEADGIDVQLFDSASSGISIIDNTVDKTTGSGINISSSSNAANSELNVLANKVSNTEYEGIEIDGFNGDIFVRTNTISNTKSEGISLENTTGNAEIGAFNEITSAAGAGIRGKNVSNLTVADNFILDTTLTGMNSDGQGEAILLEEATGDVDISRNIITGSAGSAIVLNNTSGNADIKVTGNNIIDSFSSISIKLAGTTTGTAEIAQNTISNFGIGVDVSLSDSANLSKLDITDNSITAPNNDNPLEGIKFRAFDQATANVNITGNTISNTTNDGISVGVNQNTNTQINIANNTIEDVKGSNSSYVGGAAEADGIDVQLFDSANSKISITDNTVNKTTGNGISISNNSDVANIELDVTGNTVSNTEYKGIRIDNFNGNTTVNKNTVSNAESEGIYLENTTGKVEINDNKVIDTRNPSEDTDLESGIFVWNYAGESDYTIANNTIETTFNATDYRVDGIEFNLCRDVDPIYLSKPCNSTATAKVNITNNNITHKGQLTNSGADGIDLNIGKFADATFNLTGNTVSNIPDEAVSIGAVADSTGIFNINNNTITNVGESGIEVDLFLPDPAISPALNLFNRSNTQYNITDNTIDTAKNDGIDLEIQDEAKTTITITGNSIKNIGDGESGDRAIQLETNQSSQMCVAVNNNTISASPNASRLRPNDATSKLEVVDVATISTRNGGASFTTSGTTNRSTPCP
ncbi:hypothetical protein RIVM261_015100 [Rivularia sp. IAM M-261]|nr:hypothetical protein RIVM261_015100 [Rivularia sp. IAM M-261]